MKLFQEKERSKSSVVAKFATTVKAGIALALPVAGSNPPEKDLLVNLVV